jgi:hypothetical protein
MERVNRLSDAPPTGKPVRLQPRYPTLGRDVPSDPADQPGFDAVVEPGLPEILPTDALSAPTSGNRTPQSGGPTSSTTHTWMAVAISPADLHAARTLLLDLAARVSTACEQVDLKPTPYVAADVTWEAIGVRIKGSQVRRQSPSSLPMPVSGENVPTATCGLSRSSSSVGGPPELPADGHEEDPVVITEHDCIR